MLKGSVPDSRAKQKAARLAQDTVGVDKVVDQLAVVPRVELRSARSAILALAVSSGGILASSSASGGITLVEFMPRQPLDVRSQAMASFFGCIHQCGTGVALLNQRS